MLASINDPTMMIKTLASLIGKDGTDLVFVPTRRAGRALEREVAALNGGAALMPKIVGLGESDEEADTDPVERKIAMARLVQAAGDAVGAPTGFAGALDVAGELLTLSDYLENAGVDAAAVDWTAIVPDARKAAFLECLKSADFGRSMARARNASIVGWIDKISQYDRVFLVGSTGSVAATRDLMEAIAAAPNGMVILLGLVEGADDIGRTDPYWSIKQVSGISDEVFASLADVDLGPAVKPRDDTKIKFFNKCFANDLSGEKLPGPDWVRRVDCATEDEEANAAMLIAAAARARNESVIIITPDAAGGQRLTIAAERFGLAVDSSGGVPMSQTAAGRLALRRLDFLVGGENAEVVAADIELLGGRIPKDWKECLAPIAEAADLVAAIEKYNLDIADAAEIARRELAKISVRPPESDFDVAILGTAEARMMTADCVILTGLNEGMFPGMGWTHSWLPRGVAEKIGLPSADSKVSLQALDFMTLSCNRNVWWLRSKMAGGSETTQSRFLSRVEAMCFASQSEVDLGPAVKPRDDNVLSALRAADDLPLEPISTAHFSAPYDGDFYATWIEDLLHNPYQFYAKHILNLRRGRDPGEDPDARDFGNLVHSTIEQCGGEPPRAIDIENKLLAAAEKIVAKDSVLFRFWRNRFGDIAAAVAKYLASGPGENEKQIDMNWGGRRILARADRIDKGGRRVVDYKTGAAPGPSKLGIKSKDGFAMMPQLPLEAMMLGVANPEMAFLQMPRGRVELVEYDAARTAAAIEAVRRTLVWSLETKDWRRPDHPLDDKYKEFDDLSRSAL
ncbi:MAG: PD-(D/E)XK nuclease family protein [Rickettsiales bacterium]|jgi:inactivated superfamily I helicase/RecB family exonuclease|nr:PD-(D/E)XK nuclease family protein [Rickettsiales bacterium]